MSIRNYYDKQLIHIADSNDLLSLGSFESETGYLEYIRVKFGILKPSELTTESGTLNIYGQSGALLASNSKVFTDIDLINWSSSDPFWMGWIAFQFTDISIHPNAKYTLKMQFSNYTRTSDFFIGILFDKNLSTYDGNSLSFELFTRV